MASQERKQYIGIVVDCIKTPIYATPSYSADKLGEVSVMTEIRVIDEMSDSDFLNVCLPSGVEGYILQSYVDRKEGIRWKEF